MFSSAISAGSVFKNRSRMYSRRAVPVPETAVFRVAFGRWENKLPKNASSGFQRGMVFSILDQRQRPMNLIKPQPADSKVKLVQVCPWSGPDFRLATHHQSNPDLLVPLPVA